MVLSSLDKFNGSLTFMGDAVAVAAMNCAIRARPYLLLSLIKFEELTSLKALKNIIVQYLLLIIVGHYYNLSILFFTFQHTIIIIYQTLNLSS